MHYSRAIITSLLLAQLALPQLVQTASAHEAGHEHAQPPMSSALQVNGPLPALPAGVTELKFSEIYKLPVGPRGMEPSAKLLSLNGKQVRLVGYMAKQDEATPGVFILSPLPVLMGHEDESFADDMPANSVFVHLHDAQQINGYVPGLINLSGVLSVGEWHEVDGRISYVRLQLDAVQSAQLVRPETTAALHSTIK
ncbi:hypothetical protein [Methylovorus mays]|uniref:hypothetical protein n=1 Tax=Methylovorus mays TaxID=184077 RepID=UPI001E48F330|nr:hypothetical protein [Methylovorus mays]MCB5206692.1 hypothetical protein [Methylovorus mays]